METAFLVACGLLLLGFVLRAKLRVFQVLYIPASIIGGLIGLAGVQAVLAVRAYLQSRPDFAENLEAAAWDRLLSSLSSDVVAELQSWPGWLIAVVFAALLLEKPGSPLRQTLRLAGREGIVVWIIALGQVTLGLLATWLVIQPFYEVPNWFGMMLETGFAGGHGTAAAMGQVLEGEPFRSKEGLDLGIFMATVGLVYSVVSGMAYVNVAVRRGWTKAGDVQIARLTGLEAREKPEPAAWGRVRGEVLDPLVFQALVLAAAVIAGLGLHRAIMMLFPVTERFPLFIYTLIGGLLVRNAMEALGIADLIDTESIRRLSSAAMEFLVVAAITSLNLNAVARLLVPLSILLSAGFLWTGVCLLFIGRRLLPREYWFELGIINYGMSTGTTATGLVLLRIIDKDLSSGAAEDYALAAPLSSPFVGGGIITLSLPFLLDRVYIGIPAMALCAVVVGLFVLGWRLSDANGAAN